MRLAKQLWRTTVSTLFRKRVEKLPVPPLEPIQSRTERGEIKKFNYVLKEINRSIKFAAKYGKRYVELYYCSDYSELSQRQKEELIDSFVLQGYTCDNDAVLRW